MINKQVLFYYKDDNFMMRYYNENTGKFGNKLSRDKF